MIALLYLLQLVGLVGIVVGFVMLLQLAGRNR